ncbi:MAG: restriction endonuclease subunit S [Anaerolineae bacterium]|nr:restriction endonuclease subunit S [Anaerolineae bacterium]
MGEIAKINAASLKANTAPEHINYIDIASVSVGHIDAIQPMSFLEAPGRARRIVQHGDIIWSCVRPNRRSYAIIISPVDNLIVSTGFATITPVHIPYSYLYYVLTTDEFVEYLVNHATGSAYPAVSQGNFENAQVLLPPTGLVEQFHNTVADMFGLQHTLSERNRALRETRDLLLPRLSSGELSVEELPLPEGDGQD